MKHFSVVCFVILSALCLTSLIGAPCVKAQNEIHYDGSSQMYWAFVKDSAELFTKETGVKVTAEDRKTQDAIPSLVSGRCNVGGMARKMKMVEKAQGKDLVETLIAKDHIAVFVPKDAKVDQVSLQDLKKIFSGDLKDWKDVGDAPGAIQVIIPQTKTAANRNFAELVMGDSPFAQSSVITEVAGGVLAEAKGKRAISFISYGAASKIPEFKILKVDGKSPGEAGYPIAQDMYFITEGQPTGNTKVYVDFFLTGKGKAFIEQAGLLSAK
jgi:phosphate transport system substrate-binding protein